MTDRTRNRYQQLFMRVKRATLRYEADPHSFALREALEFAQQELLAYKAARKEANDWYDNDLPKASPLASAPVPLVDNEVIKSLQERIDLQQLKIDQLEGTINKLQGLTDYLKRYNNDQIEINQENFRKLERLLDKTSELDKDVIRLLQSRR